MGRKRPICINCLHPHEIDPFLNQIIILINSQQDSHLYNPFLIKLFWRQLFFLIPHKQSNEIKLTLIQFITRIQIPQNRMEQQSTINAQIGLEQKNTILQAWADFKDSIFNVLFVILDKKSQDEQEESIIRLALESGLDYLQILAFPFNDLVVGAWNGGSSLDGLSHFFQQFSIGTYLPGAPFSAFLVVLYGLIFIILLIIIDIVYVSYSFSKKKFRFTFPLIVLAEVVPLFVTVLFLPITELLLKVVECQKETNGGVQEWVLTSFPEVVCWTGWHLFHSSITLLFVAIFVVISCVVALALFEPRMTTGKLTARQNSNGEVVFILNKIILLFIFIFMPVGGNAFYIITMLVLSFWQFWCYSINQPFYSKSATKFFKICSTYYFWTTFMLFVGLVLGDYGFDGALVIWMSGLPFFIIIIYFQSPTDVNTLFVSNLKFKSGEQLQLHLSEVLQLVGSQSVDKNSYMLLIGYIEKHKEVCTQADCPLKMQHKKRKGQQNMQYSCQQVLKQVDLMFKSGIKKFPNSTKLRLSYAFFQLEQLKNKQRAYEQFTNSSNLDPSFQQQFSIYRFKKIIRQNLQNRQGSDADLIETIRYENYVSLLEQAMVISAKLHRQFWSELKEQIPDLKKLNIVGAQITEAGNSITQNYGELSKINPSGCEVLFAYGHYLILVTEDYVQGKELLANARKIFQDRQTGYQNVVELNLEERSLNRVTSPVLILSQASAQSLPRIVNMNLMFTEVTGYQRQQLIDKDISKIAPHLFNAEGFSCLQLMEGEQRERQGFLKHKFNHLIAVQYSVVHKQEQSQWHVLFKLAPSSLKLTLLADERGQVTDYNLLAQTAFKQTINDLHAKGKIFSLAEIGITNFTHQNFKRQNGSATQIRLGNKAGECLVQIQQIVVHTYGYNEDGEDQQQKMVIKSQKSIGYRVIITKNERGRLEQEQIKLQEQLRQSQIDDGVLQLYDNPDVIDIFISNIADTKRFDDNNVRFQLKEKIRTMRLMNNEIKMVYNQGLENDYSDMVNDGQGQQSREIFKFDDEGYQAKIRSAINTNINHVQVINLRKFSIAFIVTLFFFNIMQLYFQVLQIDSTASSLTQDFNMSTEFSLLSSNVMAILDPTANYTQLYQQNINHDVTFDSDETVNIELPNNLTVNRNLKDAFVVLNSRIVSYFQSPSTPSSMYSVFKNYISSIYPALINYPDLQEVDLKIELLLGGGVFIVAVLMMAYWIYIGLLIDKKRYDIMIWFLDIPVPYVTHLGNHCDKYLKEFVSIKELEQRGLSLEDEEDNYQEYSTKKNANDDQQIEEQIKARKSLISKNKKQTLISRINISSLKVIWVLIYSLSFSILILVLTSSFKDDYNFLLPQWRQTTRTITIDNTLYVALYMRDNNIPAGTNLSELTRVLSLDHKGVITDNNLQQFNYDILTFHLNEVSAIYNTVYFSNLCTAINLTPANQTQCQTLVGSKLKSGYQIYSKYLITPQKAMTNQIWLANQLYVIPALLQMLRVWKISLLSQGSSLISLCNILLYVFIIISVLCFLLFWLYYLRRLNVQLNQTIQMLNMIPFKLLPKSRKETKMFIAWIIREANKTKHENQ